MRQQSRWKKRLAVVLAAVMTLSTGMTAMAAVGWQKEEGGWRHYKEDGTPDKDKLKPIHGQWYAFDVNGYMEENTWVVREVEEDGVKTAYYYCALPSGELANGQWVHLSEDGKKCTHTEDCNCSWYYFNPIEPGAGIGESHARRPEGGERVTASETNPVQKIKGQWYAFDENGKMFKEGFHNIKVDDKNRRIYAYPDGHLAIAGWRVIDGKWYRFSVGQDVQNDEEAQTMWGNAKTDCEWTDGQGRAYAFDRNSAMISRNWWSSEDERNLEGYYQYQGEKAVNKWLPIGNFWYQFDENGKVTAYAPTATSNNARPANDIPSIATAEKQDAPENVVKTITAEENELQVEVSKDDKNATTVDMNFKVKRATSSNAEEDTVVTNITENHDIWLDGVAYGGKYSVESDGEGGCVVQYWNTNASNVGKKETVRLSIDGILSNAVTINIVAAGTEGEKPEDPEKTDQIKDIINGSYEEGKENEAVNTLKDTYKGVEDPSVIHEELVEAVKQNPAESNYAKLEEAYVKVNKITQESPNVSDEAGDLFGKGEDADRKVEVVGGGLNAKANDSVQLVVDVPKEEVELKTEEKHEAVVSLTIEFHINGNNKKELDLPVVISMPVPEGVEEGMLLFNIHNANEAPIEVPFTIEDGRLYFATDRFSTYVFAKKSEDDPGNVDPITPGGDDDDNGGNGGGGGSSSSRRTSGSNTTAGQWIQDATGWWFRFTNGSYPANSWQYLSYNGVSSWYHFNAAGYMDSGWFTDTDGHTYYLNPVSDGTKGVMRTGWQQIDGQWYYFNPSVGGPQGSMLKSTTTPDGYAVNEKGQWIQ